MRIQAKAVAICPPLFFGLSLAAFTVAPVFAQSPKPQTEISQGDVLLTVTAFEVSANNPLSTEETASTLAPFLGPHTELSTLEAAAAALEARLRDKGFSFHRVIVPAQKPVGGVVKLELLQFPLASVGVVGNSHFSEDNIRRSLPGLLTGASPDVRAMSRELGLANTHPSKRLSIVLKESPTADALDAEIRVRDLDPSVGFVSLTGQTKDAYDAINRGTGYTRLTVGYQNTNLFDRDHALTLSYTTSPERLDRVKQYGAFYWLPLYGLDASLQFYYTRSDVDTGAIGLGATSFNVSGKGEFMGARASYALPKSGERSQNISLAIDDRVFASNLGIAGVALVPTNLRSRPLSLRYSTQVEALWGGIGADAEVAGNLSGGDGNSDAAYQAARAGAPRHWHSLRFGVDASYAISPWIVSARLRGQYTGTALIPGEQFGLGGTGSVRGLREREFTGDTGYTVSLEAKGPPLTDTLRPVIFFDHGQARLLAGGALPGGTTLSEETATSIGAGLRWNLDRRLDLSADLAYVLNGVSSAGAVTGSARGDGKLMFSAFYRF
jgi:hemolysin activation/secretion protein